MLSLTQTTSATRINTQSSPLKLCERLTKEAYRIALMPRTDGEEVSLARYNEVLTHIATNFNALSQPDTQHLLDELLVVLIMCKKGDSDKSICESDIKAALVDLQNLCPDDGQQSLLKSYLGHPELLCLFEQSVQSYSLKIHTEIKLVSTQIPAPGTPPEDADTESSWQFLTDFLVLEVNEYLPRGDKVSWANTCHTMNNIYQHRYSWPLAKNEKVAMLLEQGFTPQQIYANHPDCHRNIPSTVMGRNWLRNQGIGGPLNNQRLMNGEVSVADLLAVKKQKLEEITKNDQIGYDSRDYCETPCILQFMVDGSLDIQKIDSFTDQHVELFELPLLQQCMDNGDLLCSDVIKYFKFLGPMRAQSELRMALQDSINANLLSFSQIFEIHSQGGPQNLADYVLTDIEKSYIKKETFTAVQLLKLPAHTRGLLNAAEMLFEKHSISHEDLTSYSPDDAQKIFSALPLLSLNRISIDKLMALSLQDAKKLSKPEVQKYFEMGLLCHQDIPNIQFFEVRYATDVVQSECSFTSGAMQELIDRKVVRMEDVILLQNLNDVRTTLAEYNSSLR